MRTGRHMSAVAMAAALVAAALAAGPAPAQGTDTTRAAPPPPPVAGDTTGIAGARDTMRVAAPASPETPETPADSALRRADALIAQGHTAAGRALVDSVLRATPPGTSAYASALYARASLSTNADSAEQDYRRLTVDYPSSPRASDALLRLAQLELARGDRDLAADHLARLTREQAPGQTGLAHARTELQVALVYFDLQDAPHACAALVAARGAAPSTDVELRNRIDYNAQRCSRALLTATPGAGAGDSVAAAAPTPPDTGVAARRAASAAAAAKRFTPPVHRPPPTGAPAGAPAAAPPAPAVAPPAPAAAPTASRAAAPNPSTPPQPPAARYSMPGYTVQVAAYQTRAAAQALVDRLKERGLPARIAGAQAPYRVRVGRYTTEARAGTEARALQAKGITGFVTEAEPVLP